MKAIAIILIVVGLAMVLVKGFNLTTEKKIIDAGTIEVTKKENKWIRLPTYAGVVMAVAGAAMLISAKKQRA